MKQKLFYIAIIAIVLSVLFVLFRPIKKSVPEKQIKTETTYFPRKDTAALQTRQRLSNNQNKIPARKNYPSSFRRGFNLQILNCR